MKICPSKCNHCQLNRNFRKTKFFHYFFHDNSVKHIKKQGEWLEDEELDLELARTTKDCPELMGLLDIESMACTRLAEQLEAEKDAYKEDADYVRTLEESLSDLK